MYKTSARENRQMERNGKQKQAAGHTADLCTSDMGWLTNVVIDIKQHKARIEKDLPG